jgi:hypothetical protein
LVATISCTDGPLPLARRRLGDAVHALADPQPASVNGACHWTRPLYAELRASLRGGKTGRNGGQRSVFPCRLDVMCLLLDIDQVVAGWVPNDKGDTIARLHSLAARAWRPMDVDLMAGYTSRLEEWVVSASEVVSQTPRLFLETACPRCQASFCYRRNAGERVRQRALKVTETGCVCGSCQAHWPPSEFHWLARLLHCPPLPA